MPAYVKIQLTKYITSIINLSWRGKKGYPLCSSQRLLGEGNLMEGDSDVYGEKRGGKGESKRGKKRALRF